MYKRQVRHRALRAQLESCRRQMLEGRSLAQAVYDNRVFEPLYAADERDVYKRQPKLRDWVSMF